MVLLAESLKAATLPKKGYSMPFKRDLIIAAVDPKTNKAKLYQIPETTWRSSATVKGDLAIEIDKVVNAGGVLAAIPEDAGGSIGAACYLINLASINVGGSAPAKSARKAKSPK
jgi:hypothetical protein